jgi:hypothetical protein
MSQQNGGKDTYNEKNSNISQPKWHVILAKYKGRQNEE